MAKKIPKTAVLAGSTVEVISALACVAGFGLDDAAVFVERNISFRTAALDPLLAAARKRFPSVQFVELEIQRPAPEYLPRKMGWNSFLTRWNLTRSLRGQLDAVCRAKFGLGLDAFCKQLETVYFTGLHDYVQVFLAACKRTPRVIYPHGFDQPSRLILKREKFLHHRRCLMNAVATVREQRNLYGTGAIVMGILGRILPRATTICMPFTGVDRVATFRSGIDPVPNEVIKVDTLADTFQWLLKGSPWRELLRGREGRARAGSLLMLLSEYNTHPVWEKNRNYGSSHQHLLKAVLGLTGLKRLVIKAHVRSDGSAAKWLASYLSSNTSGCEIEILPLALSGLPVEALSLTGEFAAACSLGSCSLPPGLGFGMPHYVSPSAAAAFDEGWRDDPFWVKYVHVDRMLIEEGICIDVDEMISSVAAGAAKVVPPDGEAA